jgi:hypothetical protein
LRARHIAAAFHAEKLDCWICFPFQLFCAKQQQNTTCQLRGWSNDCIILSQDHPSTNNTTANHKSAQKRSSSTSATTENNDHGCVNQQSKNWLFAPTTPQVHAALLSSPRGGWKAEPAVGRTRGRSLKGSALAAGPLAWFMVIEMSA